MHETTRLNEEFITSYNNAVTLITILDNVFHLDSFHISSAAHIHSLKARQNPCH